MRINHVRHALSVTSALAAFVLSGAAYAQTEAAPQAAAEVTEVGADEIVVTARRKAEAAQTTPVAVTALTSAALVDNNIQQTTDLQKMVPGVVFSGAGTDANTTLYIRGQGKDVIGPGLPSVISYFNEVPLPGFGGVIPTYDISSLQVLKGPQGTLFGRNTTGGAVLIYSQAPTDEVGGYVQATVGQYNWHSIQGAVNLPITDNLAVRVAGNLERRDGYTENLGTGKDFDELHNDAFRVSIKATPFDGVENTFVYDYFYKNAPYSNIIAVGSAPGLTQYNATGLAVPAVAAAFNCITSVDCDVDLQIARQAAIGPRKVYSNVDAFDNTRVQGIANTTTIDLGFATLKNIFGWRKTEVSQRGNTDGIELTVLDTRLTHNSAQITDELQLSGSLLNDKIDYIVGGFYLRQRPIGSTSLLIDFLRPANQPLATWAFSSVNNTLYRDDSRAVFGSVKYDLDDVLEGFSASGALRYTWDKPGVCSVTLGGASTFVESTAECRTFANAFDITAKSNKLTWSFGVDYAINRNIFTYVVARRGYRAGGINSPKFSANLADLQFYKPQTVDDIEVGVKTNWRMGDFSGRFNVAAFRGKFKDLQRQIAGIPANIDGDGVSSNDPASKSLIINGAQARVQGIEVEAVIRPTSDLSFSFGGSYLDSKYTQFSNPAILNGIATAAGIFLNSPELSYNVGARYQLPIDLGGTEVAIAGDYYYTDGYRQGILSVVDSYGLANARVDITNINNTPLSLTVFVDNIFDKAYRKNGSLTGTSPGISALNIGAPRMAGVRVRYAFGSDVK